MRPHVIRGDALYFRVGDPAANVGPVCTSVVMDVETEYLDMEATTAKLYQNSWFFDVTAVQSTEPDSFLTFLWDHTGELVPFAYAPNGNEIPSVSKPHYTGILQVPPPPALGGEAGRFSEYTFTTRMWIVQGPLRVTEE